METKNTTNKGTKSRAETARTMALIIGAPVFSEFLNNKFGIEDMNYQSLFCSVIYLIWGSKKVGMMMLPCLWVDINL